MSSKNSQFNKGRSDKAKGLNKPPRYGFLEGLVDAVTLNLNGPKNHLKKQREYEIGRNYDSKKKPRGR